MSCQTELRLQDMLPHPVPIVILVRYYSLSGVFGLETP